jgi:hypothetical protein
MDVELGQHIGLDLAQEGEERLVTMAGFELVNDRAVEHVEGGEQGGDAAALEVVSDAFDVAEPMGSVGWVRSRGSGTSTRSTAAIVRWLR